jgi:hypothetical protein
MINNSRIWYDVITLWIVTAIEMLNTIRLYYITVKIYNIIDLVCSCSDTASKQHTEHRDDTPHWWESTGSIVWNFTGRFWILMPVLEAQEAREVGPIRTNEFNSDLVREAQARGPRWPISLMSFIEPKNPITMPSRPNFLRWPGRNTFSKHIVDTLSRLRKYDCSSLKVCGII